MNTQGMIPLKENDSKKISDRYQKKTYAKGATCIYGDTLYRAKADITTAEEWTAAHWEETNMETIRAEMAAEVSSLNASKFIYREVSIMKGKQISPQSPIYEWIDFPSVDGYKAIGFYIFSDNPYLIPFFNDSGFGTTGVTVVMYNTNSGVANVKNAKVQVVYVPSNFVQW